MHLAFHCSLIHFSCLLFSSVYPFFEHASSFFHLFYAPLVFQCFIDLFYMSFVLQPFIHLFYMFLFYSILSICFTSLLLSNILSICFTNLYLSKCFMHFTSLLLSIDPYVLQLSCDTIFYQFVAQVFYFLMFDAFVLLVSCFPIFYPFIFGVFSFSFFLHYRLFKCFIQLFFQCFAFQCFLRFILLAFIFVKCMAKCIQQFVKVISLDNNTEVNAHRHNKRKLSK